MVSHLIKGKHKELKILKKEIQGILDFQYTFIPNLVEKMIVLLKLNTDEVYK